METDAVGCQKYNRCALHFFSILKWERTEEERTRRRKYWPWIFRTEELVVATRWRDVWGVCLDFLWFNKGNQFWLDSEPLYNCSHPPHL